MLLSININNYTLVETLEIEFSSGTTAITGETGAGKSLVLDALGMALGDRADTGTIRHGKDRAEITATFAIDTIEDAKIWLSENDFLLRANVFYAASIPLKAAREATLMAKAAPCSNCSCSAKC